MNERAVIAWRSMPHDMKLARVRELTDEGMTAKEIADVFNVGIPAYNHITRNAIIGFWNRNNITSKSGYTPTRYKTAEEKAAADKARKVSAQASAQVRAALGKRTANTVARDTIAARKARNEQPRPSKAPELVAKPVPAPDCARPMLATYGMRCRAVVDGRDEYGLAMVCGSPAHNSDSAWCAHHARLYTRAPEGRQARSWWR